MLVVACNHDLNIVIMHHTHDAQLLGKEPHIGHLYSIVLTDSIKRWFEFRGEDALCITGTDEHGLKVIKTC